MTILKSDNEKGKIARIFFKCPHMVPIILTSFSGIFNDDYTLYCKFGHYTNTLLFKSTFMTCLFQFALLTLAYVFAVYKYAKTNEDIKYHHIPLKALDHFLFLYLFFFYFLFF